MKIEKYKQRFKESEFKGEKYYDNKYSDSIAMDELELYLENDGQLYKQQFEPIIKNIQRKLKSDKYNHSLAPKLWMYYVENGAKKYAQEFGGTWNEMFTKKDRMVLAQKLADYYYDAIMNGEYD